MFFIYSSGGPENTNKTIKSIKIFLSILLIIAGVFCIVNPLGTVATVETIAAVCILITGGFRGVEYFSVKEREYRNPRLLSGCILNILLGLLFLLLPSGFTVSFISGIITFILFIVGVFKIISATKQREYGNKGWGAGLITGIISVAVALMFIIMPIATDMLLVISLGVYLLFSGVNLLIRY